MKAFTFSDLSRRSGDVLDTALVEPVSLQKRGKTKIVMLSAEQYEQLQNRARINAPRAFSLRTAPDEDIENLTAGFQEILDDGERGGR